MTSLTTTLRKIQTVGLSEHIERSSGIAIEITDAIRATGLGPGSQFYFDPSSIDAVGLLLAFGEPQCGPATSSEFTATVEQIGRDSELALTVPKPALVELGYDTLPEETAVTIWAGSQLLGFDCASE